MADEGGASAAEFEAEPVLPPEELPKQPLTLVRNEEPLEDEDDDPEEEPPEADWREFGSFLRLSHSSATTPTVTFAILRSPVCACSANHVNL